MAKKLFFSIIILSVILSDAAYAADIDIGFRVKESNAVVPIAASTVLSASKLHIATAEGIRSLLLVLPSDPFASKSIIKLADNTVMALKRFLDSMNFPNQGVTRARFCSLSSPVYTEKGRFRIDNTSGTDAVFTLASSTGAGVSPSTFTVPAHTASFVDMGVSNINSSYSVCSTDNNIGKVVPGGSAFYFVSQNGIQTDYVIFTMMANTGSL